MRARYAALAAGAAAAVLAAVAACGGSSTSGSTPATRSTPVATVTSSVQVPAPTVTVTQSASATPAPATPTTAAPTPATPTSVNPKGVPHLTNASAVVEQYYQDITNHDYAAAWALGGSNIAGRSYSEYVAGFSTTASISLGTVSDFGASQVQAVLYATQTDGTVKVYQGTYTVSGGVLVGASIRQVG